ncbi:histidinol dehydrogenase [Atopobiaceae bacterium Sow4_H2]
MIRVDLTGGRELTDADIKRSGALPREVMDAAEAIVDDVRENGDAAVRAYCEKFDGSCPTSFRVPEELLDSATSMVDPEFLSSLELAHRQIREFHEREVTQSMFAARADGTILGVKVTPLPSVGIYVPGGRAQYPSTVLMNAVPAKVAGVDEVYAVGGAQAVGALAYGTETIPRVAKITGPGNAYVAAAKRHVMGDVGIDMVAGPSEVCVLADDTADPVVVAADLMAQAEHDPMATCYLVTDSTGLPVAVEAALARLVPQSPRADITAMSLDHGVIVCCDTLADAVAAVNVVAPEHLELHCADAMGLLGSIENAGAIFVGPWSSEPLGDYVAGPNHTLPTGGTARFSNPLGVYDFVKRSSVISYTPAGLAADGPSVQSIAQSEGLWAHALSVGMRRRLLEQGGEKFRDPVAACEDAMRCAWPRELDAAGVAYLPGYDGRD